MILASLKPSAALGSTTRHVHFSKPQVASVAQKALRMVRPLMRFVELIMANPDWTIDAKS
jgi:hypothetical protein